MALLNIYCFVTATCPPQFFFKGKKRNRKLIMKMGNPSHFSLSELIDPKVKCPWWSRTQGKQAAGSYSPRRWYHLRAVALPLGLHVREEIGLKMPCSSVLCDRWCCVSHYLAPSNRLCFAITCIKAERFPQHFMHLSIGSPESLWKDTQFSQAPSKRNFDLHIYSHTWQTIDRSQGLSFGKTDDAAKTSTRLNLGCQCLWPVSGSPYSKTHAQQNLSHLPHETKAGYTEQKSKTANRRN